MKIALPTRNSQIDSHFGHCEVYTVYTVNEQKQIVNTELVPSPQGCGCKSNIAAVLRDKGVTVMLAGNMGTGALNVLSSHNIQVIRGCSGNIEDVASAWIRGELKDSGEGCRHHEDGHECNH